MLTSHEAVVDEHGNVRLLNPARLGAPRRAIVTILDEAPAAAATETDSASGDDRPPSPWIVRYERVRGIGEGGMSIVHLARDRSTGALVCIKELRENVRLSALQQECRALARLHHPCILRLVNFETRGDRPYIVTEFGSGVPLRDYMTARLLLQEPLAAALAARIFDAVASAHAEGVIHRDLKPENILIEERGAMLAPKILDFGLAIVDELDDRDAATGRGIVAGTMRYMAPEQMKGEAVTAACDVYALGLTCWEMLTGLQAFAGPIPKIVTDKMLRDGLVIDGAPLRVSAQFAELIHACTRVDPSHRPGARTVADTLSELVPTLPPQASLVPLNLALRDHTDERPAGWFDGLGYVADASMYYECSVGVDPATGLECARLQRAGAGDEEFGVLMQRIPAAHLAGTVVRFAATVRSDSLTRWAGLWLRADGPQGRQLAFYNMRDRPIRGTTGWNRYTIELQLPHETAWLNFGVVLAADGALLVREAQLEAETRDRPVPLGSSVADAGRPLGSPSNENLT